MFLHAKQTVSQCPSGRVLKCSRRICHASLHVQDLNHPPTCFFPQFARCAVTVQPPGHMLGGTVDGHTSHVLVGLGVSNLVCFTFPTSMLKCCPKLNVN